MAENKTNYKTKQWLYKDMKMHEYIQCTAAIYKLRFSSFLLKS